MLSMGRLVIDDGFAVYWTREGGCQLVRPDGRVVQLTLERYVPTLKSAVAVENVKDEYICPPCVADVRQEEPRTSSWCAPALGVDEEEDGVADDTVSREDRLRAEATSVRHLMTHHPRNPYCGACAEAKIRAQPARRHDPEIKERPDRVGDLVYADHLILNDDEKGHRGERAALTMLDLGTGCGDFVGCPNKSSKYAEEAIRHFMGSDTIKIFYSDGSPELRKTAQCLRVAHGRSTPYRPQSNSRIELHNQLVLRGGRSALLQSGLPHAF